MVGTGWREWGQNWGNWGEADGRDQKHRAHRICDTDHLFQYSRLLFNFPSVLRHSQPHACHPPEAHVNHVDHGEFWGANRELCE